MNLTVVQLLRASQLSQRTNQFNCNVSLRLSPHQLAELHVRARVCDDVDAERLEDFRDKLPKSVKSVEAALLPETSTPGFFTATATDQFGHYGLIALLCVVAPTPTHPWVSVPLLLLSCRILGRGIALRLLQCIAVPLARRHDCKKVRVRFLRTVRNHVALDALLAIDGAVLLESDIADGATPVSMALPSFVSVEAPSTSGTHVYIVYDAERLAAAAFIPRRSKAAAPSDGVRSRPTVSTAQPLALTVPVEARKLWTGKRLAGRAYRQVSLLSCPNKCASVIRAFIKERHASARAPGEFRSYCALLTD